MSRKLSFVLVVALAAALLTPGRITHAAPGAQAGVARVRFVNASIDAAGLDAYGDGVLWTAGLVDVTGYMNATPGEHTFSFRRVGRAEDLVHVTATIDAGQRVTIAAINRMDSLEALALVDDVSAPARNSARLKVVHAAPGVDPLTLRVDRTRVALNLAYGEVSDAAQFFAGSHNVSLRTRGDSPLVLAQDMQLAGSRAYTLFVVPGAEDGTLRLLPAESSVLKPDASSQFRFANMIQGGGALAVYVNHEIAPLYGAVNFSSVTTYYVTGQGEHLVEVYPVGSGPQDGPPLAAGTAAIGPDSHVVFVAQGTVESPDVAAYSVGLGPLAAGSARLQVIDAAVGNPAIRVSTRDGIRLCDRVAVGGSATRVIPVGVYALHFDDAGTGDTMMERPAMQVTAGTAVVVIAFDDDPEDPLINAVAVRADNVPQHAAVRWAHLSAAGPALDVVVDGEPVLADFAFEDQTAYQLVEPHVVTVDVYPAGGDHSGDKPLIHQRVDLTGTSSPRTLYVVGPEDALRLAVAADNVDLLAAGGARLRFINAAELPGSVTVVTGNGTRLAVVPAGAASPYVNVDAGDFALDFVDDAGNVALSQDLAVAEGVIYTVVLAGSGGDLVALVVEDVP